MVRPGTGVARLSWGAVEGWENQVPQCPSFFSQHLISFTEHEIFILSLDYQFFGGRNHNDLVYLSNPNMTSRGHLRCLRDVCLRKEGRYQQAEVKNGVHGSQTPTLGNYLEGHTFIWERGYSERCERKGGRWGRIVSGFSVDELILRWLTSIQAEMPEVCAFLITNVLQVRGNTGGSNIITDSYCVTVTLLGRFININSNSHKTCGSLSLSRLISSLKSHW